MSIASGFTKMKNYILTSSGYKLLSRWTSSQTVHMGDGTDDTDTVEYRFGAMKGITSSLATDNDEFAISASAGKNLQDQCTQLNQSLTKLFTVVNFHTYNGEQWVDVPLPDGWKTGNTAIIAMRVGNYITQTVNNKCMYECFVKDENTYMIIGRDITSMNVDGHMVIVKI